MPRKLSPFADRDRLSETVKNSQSIADVLRAYGRYNAERTGSGGYKEIHRYLTKYEIDTSHFLTRSQHAAARFSGGVPSNRIPLEEILDGQHPSYPPAKLKKRLISAGLKKDECEDCGIPNIWNDKPLTLQCDHINGDNRDHRLANLRILCPNCHSQTPTYGSKVR